MRIIGCKAAWAGPLPALKTEEGAASPGVQVASGSCKNKRTDSLSEAPGKKCSLVDPLVFNPKGSVSDS